MQTFWKKQTSTFKQNLQNLLESETIRIWPIIQLVAVEDKTWVMFKLNLSVRFREFLSKKLINKYKNIGALERITFIFKPWYIEYCLRITSPGFLGNL